MPLIGFENDQGERLTFEETWKRKSFAGLPVEVLYRMYLNQVSDARPDGLTVTGLLGCPRKAFLQRVEPYYANPRFIYALFRGSMVHAVLEDTNSLWDPKSVIREVRYHRKVPGTNITISGKVDKYLIPIECLDDYKTIDDDKVADLEKRLPEDYIKQTNVYRWIMEGNGLSVKKIRITFFSFRYAYTTGTECLLGASWSRPRWVKIPEVPLLRLSSVEDLVVHRAKDITRTELPPPVEPSGRWMCNGCAFKKRCWPEE